MTDEKAEWDFKPDGETKTEPPRLDSRTSRQPARKNTGPEYIEWTAAEYIEHQRGASWYLALIMVTTILAVVVYLVTRDYFAVAVSVLAGLAVGIFSIRKPQKLSYSLSSDGLKVGDKTYTYSQFKSFAIIREGGLSSINLMPVKRFMPTVSVYFEPNIEPHIVQIIGQHLPFERRELEPVERLSRRLRL